MDIFRKFLNIGGSSARSGSDEPEINQEESVLRHTSKSQREPPTARNASALSTRKSRREAVMQESEPDLFEVSDANLDVRKSTQPRVRSAKFKRTALQPVHQDEIEIIDSDHDEEQPTLLSLRSNNRPLNPITQRVTKRDWQETGSAQDQEEARLLGGPSPPEPGATIIPDPMSLQRHKPSIPSGVVPKNSLGSTNSRSRFVGTRVKRAPAQSHQFSDELVVDPGPPLKKQRLNSESPSGTNLSMRTANTMNGLRDSKMDPTGATSQDPIALNDSQDGGDSVDIDLLKVQFPIEHRSSRPPSPQQSGAAIHSSPLAEIVHQKRSPVPEAGQNGSTGGLHMEPIRNGHARRPETYSVFKDPETDEDAEHQFMKDATKQRKNKVNEGHRLDAPFQQTTPRQTSPSASVSRNHISHKSTVSPSASHRHQPSESPDALHSEGTTINGVNKRGRTKEAPPTSKAPPVQPASTRVNNSSTAKQSGSVKHKAQKPTLEVVKYDLVDVAGAGLPHFSEPYYAIAIDLENRQFWINPAETVMPPESMTVPRSLKQIRTLFYGETKNLVHLKFSEKKGVLSTPLLLAFESHYIASQFIKELQNLDEALDVRTKDDQYLENVQKKYQQADLQPVEPRDMDQIKRAPRSPIPEETSRPSRAGKHDCRSIDRLDRPIDANTMRTRLRDRDPSNGHLHDTEQVSHTNVEEIADHRVENKNILESDLPQHTTRSRRLRSTREVQQLNARTPSPPKTKYFRSGQLGEPWQKPLVYPAGGKKREIVEFGELERLDDDEFLNDTLINFFLRYVQHQIEQQDPERMKKMHFFNSYFYETLTRGIKGRREINHQGVSKWTKTVDIFSRDFVIVPVNENLHWYVAIICNLSYFKKKKAQEDSEGEREASPSSDAGQNGVRTRETQESFEELTIQDQNEHVTSSGRTLVDASPSQWPSTPRKNGKKKRAPPARKYDVEKPVIICLDSLSLPRSSTSTCLKQYIVQEAKDKLGLEIDTKEINGMTAQGIPRQGNYSDCGLYVCMYLEQFITDPRGFVGKLLRRDHDEMGWPESIAGAELRRRMRELILELHHEQEGEKSGQTFPAVGKILVDMGENEVEVQEVVQQPPDKPRSTSGHSLAKIVDARKRFDLRQQASGQIDGHDTTDEITTRTSRDDEETEHVEPKKRARGHLIDLEAEVIEVEDDVRSSLNPKSARNGRKATPSRPNPFNAAVGTSNPVPKSKQRGQSVESNYSITTEVLQGERTFSDLGPIPKSTVERSQESDSFLFDLPEWAPSPPKSAEIPETQEHVQDGVLNLQEIASARQGRMDDDDMLLI